MTDISRRDLSPEAMAHQAVLEALADAGVEPAELGLVLVIGNAMAGGSATRAASGASPGCARPAWATPPWSTWTTRAPAARRALHLGTLAARSAGRPVLVLGRREDVDRGPGGHPGRDRGRAAGRLPGRPARPATNRAEPGGQHAHGPQRPLGRPVRGRAGDTDGRWPRRPSRPAASAPLNPWPSSSGRWTSTRCWAHPGGRPADPAHVQLVHRRGGRHGARRALGDHRGRCAPYHRFRGPVGERIDGLSRAT